MCVDVLFLTCLSHHRQQFGCSKSSEIVIHLCPLMFWALIKENEKRLCHHGGGLLVKWEVWLVPRRALQAC